MHRSAKNSDNTFTQFLGQIYIKCCNCGLKKKKKHYAHLICTGKQCFGSGSAKDLPPRSGSAWNPDPDQLRASKFREQKAQALFYYIQYIPVPYIFIYCTFIGMYLYIYMYIYISSHLQKACLTLWDLLTVWDLSFGNKCYHIIKGTVKIEACLGNWMTSKSILAPKSEFGLPLSKMDPKFQSISYTVMLLHIRRSLFISCAES